ncbi:hypothetical protein IKG50_00920 [Candidatus Saccharibacteria bacterium]|nr:hypothetical protein [Candidatus Saccharibacteria bacterium]
MSEEEDEKRLEGAISSGDLESDFPETKEAEEKEEEKKEEGEEMPKDEENKDLIEETPTEETPVEEAPVEDTPAEKTPAVESTEEAPAAEETPEVPAEEPKAEPVVEAAPITESNAITPKKKSKKGLIAFLIIFAVLLIGGGVGFAVWAMIHEAPDAALRDALANFWAADDVQFGGNINSTVAGTDMTYSVEAIKSGKNISGSGTIKAEYNGQDIELGFSAAYIDGGNVYLKLDGLKKLAEEVDFAGLIENFATSQEGDMDFSSLISSIVGSLAEKVDGNWYKITASDVKEYNSGASCILENLGDIFSQDSKDKIADIYKDNAFLEIDDKASVSDKDGAKVYTLKVNKDKSKEFSKKIGEADAFEKLTKCSESSSSSSEKESEEKEELPDAKIKVSITPWTHKLVGVQFIQDIDGNETNADLKVTYDKKSVEEPSDAKKIDTLKDDIEEALSGAMTEFITDICKSVYGEYGDDYVNACVESSSQSMSQNGTGFSGIIQQFLGGGDEPDVQDCTDGETDC